ncbi:MAG: hypothetical protein WBQ23_10130 [Bacteroidota bacterium]
MSTELITYEPIDIPFKKQKSGSAKIIEKVHVKEFWEKVEAKRISDKQGCYIFALRASKGFTAWYIGRATKNFEQECFTSHKLVHYNGVLFDGRKGTPVMFFIAPSGDKKKVSAKICDEVETFLIQAALVQNPEIRNRQKTNIPDWTIAGVVRRSRGGISKKAKNFRTMLGLK